MKLTNPQFPIRNSRRRGFTLVEVLITVAIVAVVSAYVVGYGRSGRGQVAVFTEAQKMAEFVLRAKSLAVTTFASDPSSFSAQTCGYGLDIDYPKRTYRIFSYEPPAPRDCFGIQTIQKPNRRTVEAASLPDDILLDISPSDRLRAVLFVPPGPRVFFSNDDTGNVDSGSKTIYLRSGGGDAARTVTVGAAGQVDF